LLAHGFSIEMLVEIIHAGLATATAEHVIAGSKTMEIARVRITEEGRLAVSLRFESLQFQASLPPLFPVRKRLQTTMTKFALYVFSLWLISGCFAPPAVAGSIEHWKCGPFDIRIDRAAVPSFETIKGKEIRSEQYDFLRVKAGTNDATKWAFWSGVSVKDRRRSMAGTLETDIATGRTTYTEESFIGQQTLLGKVVKTCKEARE
jgi:hypothetical protein